MEKSPITLHKKLFYHPERLGEFLNKGTTTPISWELDPTNNCNHECIGCYAKGAGGRTNNEFLRVGEAKSYIDQIHSLNSKAVVFTGGGAPMMNRATPEIIEYSRSKGMDVGLITNGSFFNKRNSPIISDNCTWVRISLDSGSPELFNQIRRRPGKEFFDILDRMKLLVDARDRRESDCTIGVGVLPS